MASRSRLLSTDVCQKSFLSLYHISERGFSLPIPFLELLRRETRSKEKGAPAASVVVLRLRFGGLCFYWALQTLFAACQAHCTTLVSLIRIMNEVFRGPLYVFVVLYLDDLLVYRKTFTGRLQRVDILLETSRKQMLLKMLLKRLLWCI